MRMTISKSPKTHLVSVGMGHSWVWGTMGADWVHGVVLRMSWDGWNGVGSKVCGFGRIGLGWV